MSLRSLILELGSTLGDAGRACGVDPVLFERIDQGRQPLPRVVARSLAAHLGIQEAEAIVEAPSWVDGSSPALLRPAPPLPGIDFVPSPRLVAPGLVRPPAPDLPAIFSLTTDWEAGEATVARIGRHAGERRGSVVVPEVMYPPRAVAAEGVVWAFGGEAGVLPPSKRVVFGVRAGTIPELVAKGADELGALGGIAFDRATSTLWVARTGASTLSRISRTTAEIDLETPAPPGDPNDVAAAGGRLFAPLSSGEIGVYDAETGVEIDFVISLPAPGVAIAASPDEAMLYVVTGPPWLELFALDPLSLVLTPLPLVGASMNDPRALLVSETRVWVSDRTSPASDARVVRVDRQTGAALARAYPTNASGEPAGQIAFDGLYVWMPDLGGGPTRKLHPETLETLLEAETGEACTAIAVVG